MINADKFCFIKGFQFFAQACYVTYGKGKITDITVVKCEDDNTAKELAKLLNSMNNKINILEENAEFMQQEQIKIMKEHEEFTKKATQMLNNATNTIHGLHIRINNLQKQSRQESIIYNTKEEHAVDNIKVIGATWFNELGIVKGEDQITKEIKIYIGNCPQPTDNEKADIEYIVKLGAKFTPEQFKTYLKWMGV